MCIIQGIPNIMIYSITLTKKIEKNTIIKIKKLLQEKCIGNGFKYINNSNVNKYGRMVYT